MLKRSFRKFPLGTQAQVFSYRHVSVLHPMHVSKEKNTHVLLIAFPKQDGRPGEELLIPVELDKYSVYFLEMP